MYTIRRFGVARTATLVAVMYLLIIAIFIVPAAIFVAAFGGNNASGGAVGVLVIGLFVAAIYAVFGWLFTALACLLYNVAAGWVGGIEVQVEAVVPPQGPPAWGPPVSAPPQSPPVWGPPVNAPPPATPPTAPPPTATPPTDPPAS
jgi:hypothetical protein